MIGPNRAGYEPGALVYSELAYLGTTWSSGATTAGTLYQIGGSSPIQVSYTPAVDCWAFLTGGVAFYISSTTDHQYVTLCVYQSAPTGARLGSSAIYFPFASIGTFLQVSSKRLEMVAGTTYTFDLRIGQRNGTCSIGVYSDPQYTFLRLEVYKKP